MTALERAPVPDHHMWCLARSSMSWALIHNSRYQSYLKQAFDNKSKGLDWCALRILKTGEPADFSFFQVKSVEKKKILWGHECRWYGAARFPVRFVDSLPTWSLGQRRHWARWPPRSWKSARSTKIMNLNWLLIMKKYTSRQQVYRSYWYRKVSAIDLPQIFSNYIIC